MSESINPLSMMATAPLTTKSNTSSSEGSSWFQAMAEAWGETLNRKAGDLEASSAQLAGGDDRPATITMLSTQAMEMGFLSTSSHTSITSAGEALKTMAQKS